MNSANRLLIFVARSVKITNSPSSEDQAQVPLTAPQATIKNQSNRRPIVDDHRKVDKMVHAVCHWFHRRNSHYHYEDLYSIASQAMLEARADYNPYRGAKLATHVWNRIRYALLGFHSQRGKDGARCRDFSNLEDVTEALDCEGLPCGAVAGPDKVADRKRFDAEQFLSELSSDAAEVVKLVWGSFEGDPTKLSQRESKGILQRALETLSWEVGRFMRAVTEVREQLT